MDEQAQEKPKLKIRRGINSGRNAAVYIRTPITEEMDALDRLGPLVRAALNEAPLQISATKVLSDIEAVRHPHDENLRLDPKDPELDKRLAHGILMESAKTVAKDRAPEDAALSIKPLRPRKLKRSY